MEYIQHVVKLQKIENLNPNLAIIKGLHQLSFTCLQQIIGKMPQTNLNRRLEFFLVQIDEKTRGGTGFSSAYWFDLGWWTHLKTTSLYHVVFQWTLVAIRKDREWLLTKKPQNTHYMELSAEVYRLYCPNYHTECKYKNSRLQHSYFLCFCLFLTILFPCTFKLGFIGCVKERGPDRINSGECNCTIFTSFYFQT